MKSPTTLKDPSRGKLILSPSQEEKYLRAPVNSDVRIPFTHANLHQNTQHSGGFIPLILAALASSVAGGLIERGIAGAGIHKFLWHTGNHAYQLSPSGKGIHLTPWRGDKKHFTNGRGLYLNKGKSTQPASENHLSHLPSQQKKLIKALVREAIHQ